MAIIEIHVGKNMVDDILLDGSLGINAIIDGLRGKLGLLPPQPTPFNFNDG
jgi:hypothetical protein